jgi:transcriptional regulator with XRE-family HTH domain
MATGKDLPQDVGAFIRDLRQTARISLRQLADRAGVSNPYLSQIERGLRKPSAEVLQQLASALRVSTPAMYLRAGLLDGEGQQGVLAAIAVDPDLTMAQKQSLTQIYETFRNENARQAAEAPAVPDDTVPDDTVPDPAVPHPAVSDPAAPGLAAGGAEVLDEDAALRAAMRDQATAEEQAVEADEQSALKAVVEDVAVVEGGAAPAPRTTQTTQPEEKQ